ncbi:phosphonate ABC transporter, permease protein PhnE [Streptomyces sp. MP131-18]|uniref:phosphonate ABC transporter, permease protein PhnE n=1 Tax=Streptomyces sp. MP131-18 TaxID=1857892 RepID=UPI0009A1F35E|nr:phosphonate ABC transporter, permease protein PhnE [Streptomyces sp. MP131-18]ONK09707.1 Phosphate-import permease protein PhnE [Streptomyces sp. MP131-18]
MSVQTRPDRRRSAKLPAREERRRTVARPTPAGLGATFALLLCVGGGVWAFAELQLNLATVVDSAGNARDFLERMLPLQFPPVGELLDLTWQTLAIVIAATALSVLLSVPLGLLAARNTTPGGSVRSASRALIVLARAIPDAVFAIAAFRVFGLGAMTGVVAMGLHSVGMVGKLYADAFEEIDEGPRDALRAAGAGRLQQIAGAVLPQALPSLVATALHRLDINLRVSVVLGFVGVNGLGYALSNAIARLDYQEAMGIALVVLLLCFAAEAVSGKIRRSLLREVAEAPRAGVLRRVVGRRLAARTGAGRHEPVAAGPQGAGTRRRTSPPWDAGRVRRAVVTALTCALVVASGVRAGISPDALARGAESLLPTIGDFLPPSTGGIGDMLLENLWITVQIALAGTLIGVVLALPLGALAARNVVPSPAVARFFRSLILLVRGLPELVLAIVFVVVTGLGPVAGAFALGIGSVGLLGKLVADSLEEVDPGPARAVLATGAGRGQIFFTAVLPRAWPTVLAHLLYTLDVNIRSATLLGIVGAGGIGYDLLNAARVQQFDVVTVIVLMVLAVVLFVEGLALWVRKVFA